MELNLLPILNDEGKRLTIDLTLSAELWADHEFQVTTPVEVHGAVVNIGGCLELTAEGSCKLNLTCDRCAETFSTEFSFTIEERYKKETADENPDITILEGTVIDLDEVVYDALVLALPSKVLCQEDCQGLCPQCGKNLNQGSCECDTRSTDPRFDILDTLL